MQSHLNLIVDADRHPDAAFDGEASDVPPSSQHATGATVAGAGSSDVGNHNTTKSDHIHSEPKSDSEGLHMKNNKPDTQNRGKHKSAARDSVAVGGAQKKQRSVSHVQAQQAQVTEPLNRRHGSQDLQTQSPEECPLTALQSADNDVAEGCIALLALHRATAEGVSTDSDDINVVGGSV